MDESVNVGVTGRRRGGWIAAALFVAVTVAYLFPAMRFVMDSHYSMLVSEQLWRAGNMRLEKHFERKDVPWPGQRTPGALPYQVYVHRKHVYYMYPPGASVLSVPLVMALNVAGVSAVRPDGGYSYQGETQLQRVVASVVTGGTVALLFLLALRFVDTRRALVLALVAAFATGLWSTASRVVWSHTWGLLLLSGTLLLLVRAAQGERLRPVLLATLLSWLYFTRPTFSISIVAVTLFVLLRHRKDFLPLALAGGVWLVLFMIYSRKTCGHLLPIYYTEHTGLLSVRTLWDSFAGTVASPGRGVLVYSPVVLAALWLALRRGAWRGEQALALLAFGALSLHFFMMCLFPIWWAGFCYGARYVVDLTPWLALLAAIGWRGAIAAKSRSYFARGLTALAIAVGVLMQGIAAFRPGPWLWSASPKSVDDHPERLWEWRDPPFLR